MRQGLVATVIAVVLAGGWLSDCNIWHGEQTCREMYTKTHIPPTGQLREKGRDCHTGWADHRTNCEGQA